MVAPEVTHNAEMIHEDKYPSEGTYFVVYIALAVLTVVELLVVYLPGLRIPLLAGLALSKAWLVIQYYMHLRYDSRLFSWVFLIPAVAGIILTILIPPFTAR
jgi:cytochrome c oxidase subunit 4